MKRGNSVCFLKVGNQVVDTTTLSECKLRVTGAMHVHKGKIKLIPWSRQIEKEYKGETGIVLASGPLMLKDDRFAIGIHVARILSEPSILVVLLPPLRGENIVDNRRRTFPGASRRSEYSGTGTFDSYFRR